MSGSWVSPFLGLLLIQYANYHTLSKETLALKQDFNRSNPLCEPSRLIGKIEQKITDEVRDCYSSLFHALFKAKDINVHELSPFL